MALITFLSDFGHTDHYVAAVKARILLQAENQPILDISHQVKKHDIIHAAHVLQAILPDFPEGTVHLVAVKTHALQSQAPYIALRMKGQYFVGPNNGIFSLIGNARPEEIVQLPVNQNASFPARDVLAEVARQLANGKTLKEIGSPTDDFVAYKPQEMRAQKELIQGQVVHIDTYGNLVTNIEQAAFEALRQDRPFLIQFRGYKLDQLNPDYQGGQGEAFALFNSQGLLEIGILHGDAGQLLGLEFGSPVMIKFEDK